MSVSEWYSDFSKEIAEQQDLECRLKAAWVEYDSTVASMKVNRREYLKEVSKKHNVSFLDVLEWYNNQPEEFIR